MRIREFGDRDLAAVMALWRACDLTRPWNPPERDIEFCRSSAHAKLFVAEAQGCIVGSIMVGHDGHRGWVYYVAVDPSHRRDGLGRALMDRAERFLTDAGVPKVMPLIRETNTPVADFYSRLGYVPEPRVLMTKWLRDAGKDPGR